MMTTQRIKIARKFLASSSTLILLLGLPRTSLAQDEGVLTHGKQEYQSYCATCHGAAAKGNGPMAELLTRKPTDLTQLSQKNGGEFPFWRVYRIIDGREEVMSHGARNMPVWGAHFSSEASEGPDTENKVLGRVLGLVYYLQSIQEK
jgi:mono/diheme cytochrome c family protein